MTKCTQWSVLLCLFMSMTLTIGCGASRTYQDDDRGRLAMPLVTSVNGTAYRLINVRIAVRGQQSLEHDWESDPNESTLSITLTSGAYSVSLEAWTLQRADSQGTFRTVEATLESSPTQNVTIFAGSTATVAYTFRTDAVIVGLGSGYLNVQARIDLADAACTPFGLDCPSGSWCPPSGLTGADMACISAGSVPLGQPCSRAIDCVPNSTCMASDVGTLCVAICAPNQFGRACDSGVGCQRVSDDYGVCGVAFPGDAGVPRGDAMQPNSDAALGSSGQWGTTLDILNAQGPNCFGCAVASHCFDPLDGSGTCEDPPPGAHGSFDGQHSFTEMCQKTLNHMFASGCAPVEMAEIPCLCGTAATSEGDVACFNGTAAPTGPVYPDYVEDFGNNIRVIFDHFRDRTFGAGLANYLAFCAAACPCGQ